MEDHRIFLIKAFAPYCVRKNNKEKYDLVAGYGMFIVAEMILQIGHEDYLKKDSWFQKLCEEILNERPILAPNQAKKLSRLK